MIKGDRGNPRDWIYSWHDLRPGWDKDQIKLEEWVRNKRCKLYRDGRLFDISSDPHEEHPLIPEADQDSTEGRRALQPLLN